MNSYGHKLMRNLPEKDPDLYTRLKKAGDLEAFCKMKGEQAAEQKMNLMESGMRDYEAEEVVIQNLYAL